MEPTTAIPFNPEQVEQTKRYELEPSEFDILFPPVPHYELLGTLGRGGQSIVFQVADKQTGRMYAFKWQTPKNEESDHLFSKERTALSALSHTLTPHPYDFGIFNERHYIVMEFVPGYSLAKRAAPEDLEARIDTGLTILAGLAPRAGAIHAKEYVHCDLKRGNIIVGPTGPRIIDLGMACISGTPANQLVPSQADTVFGTPGSMAPEQIGSEPLTAQTDVYSFGLIAHELILGKPLRNIYISAAATLAGIMNGDGRCGYERPRNLPAALIELIETCTEKEPKNRYKTMEEAAATLNKV